MDAQKFVDNVKDQFEEIDMDKITLETEFKSLDSWDSLTATAIQAMIEDDYGVDVTDDDFEEAQTIQDLFNIVSNRK